MSSRDADAAEPGELPEYATSTPDVDGTEWIELSIHAIDRFKARSSPTATRNVGPRVAWFEAEFVPEPHGLDADEVRYHADTRTLLLRKDSHLVTVIALAYAKPAARGAVARMEGSA